MPRTEARPDSRRHAEARALAEALVDAGERVGVVAGRARAPPRAARGRGPDRRVRRRRGPGPLAARARRGRARRRHPPFRRRRSASHAAARRRRRPMFRCCALRRPGWVAAAGDDWHPADSLAAGRRGCCRRWARGCFLTTGRRASPPSPAPGPAVVPRALRRPARAAAARRACEVLLDRGPFTLDGERELLRRHRIDVLVTKDSGGPPPRAKLDRGPRARGCRSWSCARPAASPERPGGGLTGRGGRWPGSLALSAG